MVYDVVDGVTTRVDLTKGIVDVISNEDIYTIVYKDGFMRYTYTGPIPEFKEILPFS